MVAQPLAQPAVDCLRACFGGNWGRFFFGEWCACHADVDVVAWPRLVRRWVVWLPSSGPLKPTAARPRVGGRGVSRVGALARACGVCADTALLPVAVAIDRIKHPVSARHLCVRLHRHDAVPCVRACARAGRSPLAEHLGRGGLVRHSPTAGPVPRRTCDVFHVMRCMRLMWLYTRLGRDRVTRDRGAVTPACRPCLTRPPPSPLPLPLVPATGRACAARLRPALAVTSWQDSEWCSRSAA